MSPVLRNEWQLNRCETVGNHQIKKRCFSMKNLMTRRSFMVHTSAAAVLAAIGGGGAGSSLIAAESKPLFSEKRTWNLAPGLSFAAAPESAEFREIWKEIGLRDLWCTAYYPDRYANTWEKMYQGRDFLQNEGFNVHWVGLPLGHPKPVIRDENGNITNAADTDGLPSGAGKFSTEVSGYEHWGISLHENAEKKNIEAIRGIQENLGSCEYFLDDDFRLACSPYGMGGCICEDCQADFLQKTGLSKDQWEDVLHDLQENRDTKLLRLWVDYTCDNLTHCFRSMQEAAPSVDLGIMVMFLGSERAGIRLDDYRGALFRVGELMFEDSGFDPPKGKTDELFSVLIHRRFTGPERAFSETTMYPAVTQSLSKENMAAKMTISTIADVRNSMFMTGDAPIPIEYWKFFKPRMIHEAAIHEQRAGAKLVGPFKHYWGMAGRYLATSGPFSLFLALGVPFEVCDRLSESGWTFLGDEDAAALERGDESSPGTVCIGRKKSAAGRFVTVAEDFASLYQFRRTLLPEFREKEIPYVLEESPAVLAWYPEKNFCILWNIEKQEKTVHIQKGEQVQKVTVGPLESKLCFLK